MEGNGRNRLGWIAIALAGLALIVALSGRHQERRWRGFGPDEYNGAYGQQVVPPQAAPAPPQQAVPRPRQDFGPQAGPGYREGAFQGWRGRGGGFGGFTRWPFMLIGGLFRLLLLALLIGLVLKFLGRRRGGPPSGGHRPPDQGPRDPEKPPYTGETQSL